MEILSNKNAERNGVTLIATIVIVALGAASIILPNISYIFPALPELEMRYIVGWICILAGVCYSSYSYLIRDNKRTRPNLLQSAFYVLVGLSLLLFNVMGLLPIAFIMTVFMLLSSMLRIMYISKIHHQKGTGWVVVFCISDIIMSLMVATGYPSAAGWVLGLMFGICISLHGLTINLTSPHRKQHGFSESFESS